MGSTRTVMAGLSQVVRSLLFFVGLWFGNRRLEVRIHLAPTNSYHPNRRGFSSVSDCPQKSSERLSNLFSEYNPISA